MSTNAQEQWLQMIGAEMLRQQLEQQQQQPAPVTQAQHSWQIASDRNRAAERRTIEAAQAKERQATADRAKEQVQAQQQAADRLEQETKEAARAEWLAAGNTASTFESQWKSQYMRIMQERVQQRDAAYKAKFAQRYGF